MLDSYRTGNGFSRGQYLREIVRNADAEQAGINAALNVRADRAAIVQSDLDALEATGVRLEYLRGELHAERISYGELHELQCFGEQGKIPADDVELLEAAGVPEFPREETYTPVGGLGFFDTARGVLPLSFGSNIATA
jgi:hypothetical protein